ncbi:protein NUCLEAR FUSION DEFECTIVE 4-like [Hordeum vulgare]|nr:protein NUCLEAR FUSION DEFECTIVE 4-like [Hordeum vulgare]
MVSGDGGGRVPSTQFAKHVVGGRWFMFFASILIMAAAGGTYIFAIYSKAIKSSLGYDQQTLNTLSFFKDVGANVGILPGLINEVTPPWVVLACGAAMNLVGYLMIYLSITGRTARPPVWLMCVYIAVGANSQSFANTGALVTAVKNFPEDRGVVLGLLKGFVGLSGAIFTQLYRAIYGTDNDGADLVLLMAWLPAAISLVFIPTIRIMPRGAAVATAASSSRERKAFFYFLYASIVLAVYLLVMNVVELEVLGFPRPAYYVTATVLLLLIFFPIVIVVQQELKTYLQPPLPTQSQSQSVVPTTTTVVNEAEPTSAGTVKPATTCFQDVFRPPARGEDYTILQALFSMDMLVLFVATICGVGGTLTAIDNLNQIGQSLGYPQRSVGTFVSLVSIWNYAGRVVAGFASEHLLARYKVPRPLVLAAVLLLACAGHLLIAVGVSNGLYAASVILGFCFGAQWPLLFAIISEVFGLKYYSTLYNFGAVASPVGSYILNVRIAGRRYDEEALRQGGQGGTCIGVRCFRDSFYIIAGVTLLGALVSLLLAWRTRNFYRGDLYGKFKAEAVAMGPLVPAGEERPEDATANGAATSSTTDAVTTNGSKIGSAD